MIRNQAWSRTLLWVGLLLPFLLAGPLAAEEFGLFGYRVLEDGTVEITFFHRQNEEESIEIPAVIDAKPVTRIGDNSFLFCTNLTSVTLPDSVTSIGSAAFYGCQNIASLTLGGGVATIGERAFHGCFELDRIDLPATLTSLASTAFESCPSLEFIGVAPGNPVYASIDGVVFNTAQTELVLYPPGREGAYAIPASVRSIGPLAFSGSKLPGVTLPEGLTSIGASSFAACSELPSVALPGSLANIGDEAFRGCGKLTSITLPGSVTRIGHTPFGACLRLASITVEPDNPAYASVEGVLFTKNQTELRQCPAGKQGSYAIPGGVTTVGRGAFFGCRALTALSFPNGLASIGASAMANCTRLSSLILPEGLISIGDLAFGSCSSLTSVSLPKSLTLLGAGSFSNCLSLTEAMLPPGITVLSESLFSGCSRLASVAVPAAVTAIRDRAFADCSALTDLALPDGLVAIGSFAFSNSGLPGLSIPESVLLLGSGAFSDCRRLSRIVLPGRIRTLAEHTFQGCSGLESVALPDRLVSMKDGAFYGCAALTNLHVPDRVAAIGAEAFAWCLRLSSITLGAGVSSIGPSAFYQCTGLQAIEVRPDNPHYASLDGVLFDKPLTALVQYPPGRSGAYGIPSGTARIADSAFENCAGLTQALLPDSVRTLGASAFSSCPSLTSVTLGTGVAVIGDMAFANCPALTRAAFLGDAPGTLGRFAFNGHAPPFSIYYLSGSTGFTSPTWTGYPAAIIDEATWPAAPWLLEYGYWYDAGLDQDPDGDGVSLLMAYALDLDPHRNPAARLPAPVLNAHSLSLSFYATSAGVLYRVETSLDLVNWTTDGVALTAPGSDQRRTAAVSREAASRFLRLVVAESTGAAP